MTEQKVILYIEDEEEMIELTRLVLEREGFKVVGAVGGSKGLVAIKKERPDLVLLDLMMPDIDGWEVYRRMKNDDDLKSIPVIIVTAKTQSVDKALGLHVAKVDDYITKPFGPKDLVKSVQRVLDQQVAG